MKPSTNKMFFKKVRKGALSEIERECSCLSCEYSMEFFIRLVNNKQTKFKMYNPLDFHNVKCKHYFGKDRNDVQILYFYNENKENVGHFLCIFYSYKTQYIYVYDSYYKWYTVADIVNLEKNYNQF